MNDGGMSRHYQGMGVLSADPVNAATPRYYYLLHLDAWTPVLAFILLSSRVVAECATSPGPGREHPHICTPWFLERTTADFDTVLSMAKQSLETTNQPPKTPHNPCTGGSQLAKPRGQRSARPLRTAHPSSALSTEHSVHSKTKLKKHPSPHHLAKPRPGHL